MKLTKIFFAFVALFMLACSSDKGSGSSSGGGKENWGVDGTVIGSWELISFNDVTNEAKPRVYLALYEDGSFDLYQQFTSIEWVHYKGTFNFDGTLLLGEYQDGKEWSTYSVEFATKPNVRMRLTRSNGSDVSVYTAVDEIPQAVVEEAKEPTTNAAPTRSMAVVPFL